MPLWLILVAALPLCVDRLIRASLKFGRCLIPVVRIPRKSGVDQSSAYHRKGDDFTDWRCSLSKRGNGRRQEAEVRRGTFGKAGLLLLFATVVLLARPAQAVLDEPPAEQARRLVKERCRLCHYVDRPEAKFAPSLMNLFKRQTLMNGKPLNDQTVSDWINQGSANMPAFQYTLTPNQVRLIVSYLKGDFSQGGQKENPPGRTR